METLSTLAFSTLLYGIALAMKFTAWRHPAFRERLKEQNLTAQIRVKAGTGRYFRLANGKISSRHGIHPNPSRSRALTWGCKSSRIRTTTSAGSMRPSPSA
jgi:hypothetical protein